MSTPWTQTDAIALCVLVESVCPAFGCHVALTGGLLYKRGDRKDCDLVLYRIRQVERVDFSGLLDALDTVGLDIPLKGGPRWLVRATYRGKPIDLFFPELDGQYEASKDSADLPADSLNSIFRIEAGTRAAEKPETK